MSSRYQKTLNAELLKYKNEREEAQSGLASSKEAFADTIKNAFGEDIKETLILGEEQKKIKKHPIKDFFKKLFDVCS